MSKSIPNQKDKGEKKKNVKKLEQKNSIDKVKKNIDGSKKLKDQVKSTPEVKETKTAKDHFNQGNDLRKEKKYKEAIKSYDEALRLKYDYVGALHNKGITWADLEDYDKALSCYDKALQFDNRNYKVYFSKGKVLHKLDLNKSALACYEEVRSLNPDYSKVLKYIEKAQRALEQPVIKSQEIIKQKAEYQKLLDELINNEEDLDDLEIRQGLDKIKLPPKVKLHLEQEKKKELESINRIKASNLKAEAESLSSEELEKNQEEYNKQLKLLVFEEEDLQDDEIQKQLNNIKLPLKLKAKLNNDWIEGVKLARDLKSEDNKSADTSIGNRLNIDQVIRNKEDYIKTLNQFVTTKESLDDEYIQKMLGDIELPPSTKRELNMQRLEAIDIESINILEGISGHLVLEEDESKLLGDNNSDESDID